MALFADLVKFTPTAGGTTDWTYSAAVGGYQSPTAGGMVSGQTYKYRAESVDQSQWEIGEGSWNGTVLARTTVFYNSSGGTSKINFSTVPSVGIVAMNADIQNAKRTRTVLTSGSGTYTTPTGCKALNVRSLGGGGGGGGSGTGVSGGAGGTGGNSTFGTITASGGGASGTSGGLGGTGGGASGGDINIAGGNGLTQSLTGAYGNAGGNSAFGGAGAGGVAAAANTGGGGCGGAAGASVNSGPGGGAGGYSEKLIVTPSATYAYAVGAAGTAGTAGTSGNVGFAGGTGLIIVDEFY